MVVFFYEAVFLYDLESFAFAEASFYDYGYVVAESLRVVVSYAILFPAEGAFEETYRVYLTIYAKKGGYNSIQYCIDLSFLDE